MALTNNVNSYSELDGVYDPPISATGLIEAVFGPAPALTAGPNIGQAPTYLGGTLMAYDTVNDFWVAWDPAGANGIEVAKGILWPDSVQPELTGGDNKVGHVMVAGRVRLQDLLVGGEIAATPTQIKDAVAATFRGLGIHVLDHNEIR